MPFKGGFVQQIEGSFQFTSDGVEERKEGTNTNHAQ